MRIFKLMCCIVALQFCIAASGQSFTQSTDALVSELFGSEVLKPVESGPGILFCTQPGADGSVSPLTEGIGTWLQYALARSHKLDRMPGLRGIQLDSSALHLRGPVGMPAAIVPLARRLGATHLAFLKLKQGTDPAQLSLLCEFRRVTSPTVVDNSISISLTRSDISSRLPSVAAMIAASFGDAAFPAPPAPNVSAAELAKLGSCCWGFNREYDLPVIKGIAEIGRKDPVAAAVAIWYDPYLSRDDSHRCKMTRDRSLASDPELAYEVSHDTTADQRVHFTEIQQLSALYPHSVLCQIAAARLYRAMGDLDQEVRFAQQTVRQLPGAAQPWLSLGYAYEQKASSLRKGRTAGNITEEEWKTLNSYYKRWRICDERAVALEPGNPHCWAALAMSATFAEDNKRATAAMDQALKLETSNSEAISWALQMYQPKWIDDEVRLRDVARFVLESHSLPSDATGIELHTLETLGVKIDDAAQAAAKRGVANMNSHPLQPYAVHCLANFYDRTGKYSLAAEQYEHLLTMGVANELFYMRARASWMLAGQQDKIRDLVQRHDKLIPNVPFTVSEVTSNVPVKSTENTSIASNGKVQESTKPTAPVTTGASEGVQQPPQDPEAGRQHFLKSRELNLKKDRPGAIKELALACKVDPNNGYYHYELSQYLYTEGDKEGVLAQLTLASKVAQEDMYSRYLYDDLMARGRREDAILALKEGAAKPIHRTHFIYYTLGACPRLNLAV